MKARFQSKIQNPKSKIERHPTPEPRHPVFPVLKGDATDMILKRTALLTIGAAALLPALSVRADEPTKLKLIAHNAIEKIGNPRALILTLSAIKPAAVKKVPADVKTPLYGVLTLGDATKPTKIAVLLDESGVKPRLFVDSNADGDLTNDSTPTWNQSLYDATHKMSVGGATVQIKTADGTLKVGLLMQRRYDKTDTDPRIKSTRDKIIYTPDYAYEGEVKIGDKTYTTLLVDANANGDFRGKKSDSATAGSGVQLRIDVNGNGKFDRTGEVYDVTKPFNIGGTTYEIKNMSATGAAFEIVKSEKTVAEVLPPQDLSKGKPAIAFAAKAMDGKAVNFPGDFKGKVVMLDFWATWCPPCREEIPGLVKNYNSYHSQNFEILGVSLDQKDSADKVTAYTNKAGMTWAEIYDGKYWAADVAQKYAIESIPHAYLVDGDSGEILAEGDALRGESLEGTLKAALEKKNGKK